MDRARRAIECVGSDVETYTGKGVYVAVLDSGIVRHPDLNGRIVAFRDFTGNRKRIQNAVYDDNGHGTHV